MVMISTHKVYYVDATSGNDSNAGLSSASAWQTIAKVSATTFNPGDQILFKRGEVWREAWIVNTGGGSGQPVTYGAYGTGNKPKITGCDLLTGWTVYSGSVYQATFNNSIDTQILLEDGDHLTKAANLAGVDAAGKFFPDDANDTIYAWCTDDADPDTHTIEIGARYDTVNCDDRQYIEFQNLHFHGAGGQYGRGFGLKPTWLTPQNITLRSCEISHCFYNGVQLTHVDGWTPIATFEMYDCLVHDNLDTGVWIIGESVTARMTGLRIDGCTVYDNGLTTVASMGVFLQNCASPIVTGCEIYDNNGSLDWSDNLLLGRCSNFVITSNTIHGGNHTGIHIDVNSFGSIWYNVIYECFWNGIWFEEHQSSVGTSTVYHNTCYHNRHGLVFGPGSTIFEVSGVTAKNNIFAYNRRANVELNEDGVGADYLNNVLDYNSYQVDTGDPLYEGEFRADNPRANKTFAEWKTYTSWDANSVNTDPLLSDPENESFTLQAGSPCRNTGVVIAGIGQQPLGAAPDMGRYEYSE